MNKGLDQSFLHYGIRKDDIELIRSLCEKYEISDEWVIDDILKAYHERKMDVVEITSSDAEKIVTAAISKIN